MKKKFILNLSFFVFSIFSLNKIFSKGEIEFINHTSRDLAFKFEEAGARGKTHGWSRRVKPGKSLSFEVGGALHAADVKDLWVKYYGSEVEKFYWPENIDIRLNKKTKVYFEYRNKWAIPLGRNIFKPNSSKAKENFQDKVGRNGTFCFENLTPYVLDIDIEFSGGGIRKINLGPKQISDILNSESHGLGVKDIKDLSVRASEDGKEIEFIRWSKNINIQVGKRTEIKFEYKKDTNPSLRRKVIRAGKTEENFGEDTGEGAKGWLEFVNNTNKILKFKYQEAVTGKYRGWSEKIKPGETWKTKNKGGVASPDVRDLWIKVYTPEGLYYGKYYWSKNIRVDNDKTTKVVFHWNDEDEIQIPLRRQVYKPGSSDVVENFGEDNGPQGVVCFHNLSDEFSLGVDFKFSGNKNWTYTKVLPGQRSYPIPSGSHSGAAKDIADMVVTIVKEKDQDPLDVVVYTHNVPINNEKRTDVYLKLIKDKKIDLKNRINKEYYLIRKVIVGGITKEDYSEKNAASSIFACATVLVDSILNGNFLRTNSKINIEPFKSPDKHLRLDQISLLAAHNAFSSFKDGYRFYYQQYYTIEEQFYMGIRIFLLDCWPTKPGTNLETGRSNRPVEVKLCHGPCSLGPILRLKGDLSFKNFLRAVYEVHEKEDIRYTTMSLVDCLKKLKKLLEENPSEIIYIELENYIDQETTDRVIKESGISELTLMPGEWDIFEKRGFWPTLDWMIKNNKRVVFWGDNGPSNYMYNQFDVQIANWYGRTTKESGVLRERGGGVQRYNYNIKNFDKDINLLVDSLSKLEDNQVEEKTKISNELLSIEKKKDDFLRQNYLATINLFPGRILENAQGYISKSLSKVEKAKDLFLTVFKEKDINILSNFSEYSDFLNDMIIALKLAKLYCDINYDVLNGRILKDLIDEVIENGLQDTASLGGQVVNCINIDQVHKGNAMKIVNYFNTFAARKLENPNLILLKIGEEVSTKGNRNLKGLNLSGRRFNGEDFSGSDLSGTKLKKSCFDSCKLAGCKFDKTDLGDVKFYNIDFKDINLENSFKDGVSFFNCNLSGAKLGDISKIKSFKDSDLSNLNIDKGNYPDINFDNAVGLAD